MKENTSYNKVILLSIISLIIFLLQFNLGLVENFLLMIATHIILNIFLSKWVKDRRLPLKNKLILCLISVLLISSFFYHNYILIQNWHIILIYWIISIYIDLSGYVFDKIEKRERKN